MASQFDQVSLFILHHFHLFIGRHFPSIWHDLLTFPIFSHRILNLLKQYGGLEDYMRLNSPAQNEQQLKNFDLSEYRQVIFTTVILSHKQIIQQIQDVIKVHIVPAILDYDEMARGKHKGMKQNKIYFS